jgi:heat shock protein HslJ
MTHRLPVVTTALGLALVLSACGSSKAPIDPLSGGSGSGSGAGSSNPTAPASPLGDLADRTFLSTKITENGTTKALASDGPIRIAFSATDSISVHAGCNTMSGQVSVSGGRLTLKSPLAATEMACAEELMDQDAWFAKLLMAGGTFVERGDGMTLTLGSTTVELSDEEVVTPSKPVAGTVWRLTTIADADVASSVPDQVTATITIDAARGRILVADGCNTGSATAVLSEGGTGGSGGAMLTIGAMAMTKMACKDADRQHVATALAEVLDGTVELKVSPTGLTVINSERSLGFTAAG